MKDRRKSNLRLVGPSDPPDNRKKNRAARSSWDEAYEPIKDLEEKIRQHKRDAWKRVFVRIALAMMVIVGTYLLIIYQTYSEVRVVETFDNQDTDNSNYAKFGKNVIKYSRDGVSMLDKDGEEKWNQPCQYQTPVLEMNGDSAAVADRGGNDIMVFEKSGLKGEIHTTLPIEQITVSSQGIVGAVLKNGMSPQVVCYDATGNVLVEHKTSVTNTGYPIDISISENGYLLLVSYLYVQEGTASTKVNYYNFGNVGEDETDHQVSAETYKNVILPDTFFMGDDTSVLVGDTKVLIYKGKQIPEIYKEIKLDKDIKSSFHTEKYIGLVLKNKGEEGNELRLYNNAGSEILSQKFSGDYHHVSMSGDQIIMYDGNLCSVFTKSGVHKFEGELDVDIQEMFPVTGLNKYLVISSSGIQKIRFAK